MDQNSSQILSQLQAQQATNKGADQYLADANNQLGVSDAQNTVTGLRTSIDNTTKLLNQVAPSVMGRTGGSLVTNAQATRQIANEQAPISKNLTELGGQYTEAGTNLSNLRNQATQEAQLGYQTQQDKNSYLQNLYNTMYGKEQDAATAARQVAQDAEAKREFDAQQAQTAQNNAISQSNATSEATAKAQAGYKFKQGSQGQYMYTDANGIPISMAEYVSGAGLGSGQVLNLLKNGTSYDKNVYSKVSNLSGDDLENALKKYSVYGF